MFILYSVQFSKTIFLSQLCAVTILSPSSDFLSISLGLTSVNNFFKLFFQLQISEIFLKFDLLSAALSDVFYNIIDQIWYLLINPILINLKCYFSYFLPIPHYIIH